MADIQITLSCDTCGRTLDDSGEGYNRHSVNISVQPCPDCLEEAKLNGIQEGKDIAESETAQ